MNTDNKNDRVVAYLRKSSEDNKDGKAHKQLNSILSQRKFVKIAKEKYNLDLIKTPFEDDKTGYEAYVREGFEEMLSYLEEQQGRVDGIICTEISRLARNFGDGGRILWYLQCGLIKRIYTPTKIFTNSSSDQMMVAIELAMSKKSSDEGSERTKSGMRTKEEVIRHPAQAPILGYMGEGPRGRRRWVIDKTIAPKVKQVFEQFATGKYLIKEITKFAYDLGLRSTSSKNLGGKLGETTWRGR